MKKKLKLRAELDNNFLRIFLEDAGVILGKFKTANDRTLSRKSLLLIDKFFKKHKVSAKDIGDIELKSELPDSYTSFRIVKIILETMIFQN
jgi:hypothetical protein